MATDSIFHMLHIDTPEAAEAFMKALEESANAPEKKVDVTYHEMTDEELDDLVNRLFGDKT